MLSVMIRHEVLGLLIAGGVDMQDPLIDVSSLQHLTADIHTKYISIYYSKCPVQQPAKKSSIDCVKPLTMVLLSLVRVPVCIYNAPWYMPDMA